MLFILAFSAFSVSAAEYEFTDMTSTGTGTIAITCTVINSGTTTHNNEIITTGTATSTFPCSGASTISISGAPAFSSPTAPAYWGLGGITRGTNALDPINAEYRFYGALNLSNGCGDGNCSGSQSFSLNAIDGGIAEAGDILWFGYFRSTAVSTMVDFWEQDRPDPTAQYYFAPFYYQIEPPEIESTNTRIIDFNPQDLEVIASSTPVEFDITAYVNSDDLGAIQGIRIELRNIDQNDLLFGVLSQISADDFVIVDEEIETAGLYYYATTTDPLPVGNYRLRACLRRSVFGLVSNYFDVFTNVVAGEPDCISHQFVVGTSTFIGNLSQAGFDELNDFVTGLSATSTEALAAQCNPLNSNFGIRECLLYLFIPSGENFQSVITGLRDGILIRVPWGYVTRTVNILSSNSTSTIPAFTASIRVGSSEYEELTFDPADMIAGAGTLLDGIQDPIYEKNLEDVFRPIIQAIVAMLVLFTIMSDIMGSHKHVGDGKEK